jgi:GDP-4-dehydro-6-deoxy-D-mannose reductase
MADGVGRGFAVDLRDADAVRRMLAEIRPDVVYHLAALSSVGRSWEDPAEVLNSNVASAVNLLEALRSAAPGARVVWVSSCEVYGTPAAMPIAEDAPVQPANPYAVSKASGDLLAAVYAEAHELDLLRVRPFNHAGPGQLPIFIVSSLARQAAEGLVTGASTIEIVTGSPDTRRDFTDVRDVVRAYRLLAAQGEPGVYNVSSGRSVSANEHVALLADLVAPVPVRHAVDPALVRISEIAELRGSNDRLVQATGWRPEIPLRQTMLDTLRWWERELTEIRPTVGRDRGARSTP